MRILLLFRGVFTVIIWYLCYELWQHEWFLLWRRDLQRFIDENMWTSSKAKELIDVKAENVYLKWIIKVMAKEFSWKNITKVKVKKLDLEIDL